MIIRIAINCCTNCEYEGDIFTDGTFYCRAKDEYLDDECLDCDDFETRDDEKSHILHLR